MSVLNLVTEPSQIRATTGATVALRLNLRNKDGTVFDPTGATITAPFVTRTPTPPPVASWTVTMDVTPTAAAAVISLTAEQTGQLGSGYVNAAITWDFAVWLTDASRKIVLLHGGLQLLPA